MFSFFKKKKIVSHIRLTGVIGNVGKFKQGIEYSSQEDIIKKAFSVKKAQAVAITINSPGGSPVQSHLIYKLIREQAKKNKKKVIVFAEDVAASGGYLIACSGDEIYANASSIIGSIGVIYSSFGFKDLIQKIGVERRVYTAGKNKSTLDPFLDEKKEDIERLKSIQLELHQEFINVVEESRNKKLKTMKNRDISLIAIGLLIGAIIGGVIGNLMGWMLPEGVVKDFFLTSFNIDIGSSVGNQDGVIIIDLKIITLKFGLALSLNFTSVIGIATSYYILRFFR